MIKASNHGIVCAMLMTSGLGKISAHVSIKSSTIDPKVEAFALDGGRKLELIEGIPESEVIAQLKVIRGRYPEIYSNTYSQTNSIFQ